MEKKNNAVLISRSVSSPTRLHHKQATSLVAWFQLYLQIEVGNSESNTHRAKKADLQKLLRYMEHSVATDHPDQWTKALTEGFLRHLNRTEQLAPATVNRVLATIKHAAAWIHRLRPFLVGNPCLKVRGIEEDKPEWQGLSDLEINRLRSAAEQLIHLSRRRHQRPRRNYAIFLALLHTGVRQSELLDLDYPSQYADGYFLNLQRKGKRVTKRLRVPQPVRDAIADYFDHERGREVGPLFQSPTKNRLAVQNVWDSLRRIAAQANSTLPIDQQIEFSGHTLRHTCLRKAAGKDIRYAMKLSAHSSSQYIWRYTEPSADVFEQAIEELFD